MFQSLTRTGADAILGLMAQYRMDSAPGKVDLGVGVYRDSTGSTPVLSSVRHAEQEILEAQNTKTYVGAAGREEFNSAVELLVLGADHIAFRDGRVRTIQAPGGCGALRVGAELIRAATPSVIIHISDPTWGNHVPLLGSSGFTLEPYPYYDVHSHQLRFDAMLEHLDRQEAGDVVLIHACCHNPTGADLNAAQWESLAHLLQRKRLVPFLDLAYQGLGTSLDADVAGIRLITHRVPEALVAVSLSKNLGLYRERVGALITISQDSEQALTVQSQVLHIARSIYSMPPDHGAAISAHIFVQNSLKDLWLSELRIMRQRIFEMRELLVQHLREATGTPSFDFLATQRGMFSLLGVSSAVVDRLREKHHIYMLQDSRINLAGIMVHNAAYVAESIAHALAAEYR